MGLWRGIGGPLLAAAALSTLATPAAAQMIPRGPAGAAAPVPDGLSLNASGEVLYDSNVLRSSATAILNPNAHRDDFRYSPDLSATYGRSTGQIVLTLDGLIGRDYFQYNSYLDRNRYQGGGSLTYHSGSSCQVAVDGNYTQRQAGIRDAGTAIVEGGAPADDVGAVIDNVLTSAMYGANAGCGSPTGRLTFGGGYAHSSLSNGAARQQFGNSTADTFSGNVGLGILRPGQVSLSGSYTTIAYPDRLASAQSLGIPLSLINSGVKTYRIGVSLSRPIGSKLSGSIGISYLHSDPTGGQAAYSSPAYTLALSYAESARLTFTLTGSRDVVASTSAGALFRVVDQVLASSTYSLGSDFTLDAHVAFIANDYKDGFAVGNEPVRRNDTLVSVGGSVTYAPRSLYDVTLNVTHSNRSSDPSIFNYSSTRVGLTVAFHY
jgi:hypothetical protein